MQNKLTYEVRRILRGPNAGRWVWTVGYIDRIVPSFPIFFVEADSREGRRSDDPDPVGTYSHRIAAISAARARLRQLRGW